MKNLIHVLSAGILLLFFSGCVSTFEGQAIQEEISYDNDSLLVELDRVVISPVKDSTQETIDIRGNIIAHMSDNPERYYEFSSEENLRLYKDEEDYILPLALVAIPPNNVWDVVERMPTLSADLELIDADHETPIAIRRSLRPYGLRVRYVREQNEMFSHFLIFGERIEFDPGVVEYSTWNGEIRE